MTATLPSKSPTGVSSSAIFRSLGNEESLFIISKRPKSEKLARCVILFAKKEDQTTARKGEHAEEQVLNQLAASGGRDDRSGRSPIDWYQPMRRSMLKTEVCGARPQPTLRIAATQ